MAVSTLIEQAHVYFMFISNWALKVWLLIINRTMEIVLRLNLQKVIYHVPDLRFQDFLGALLLTPDGD